MKAEYATGIVEMSRLLLSRRSLHDESVNFKLLLRLSIVTARQLCLCRTYTSVSDKVAKLVGRVPVSPLSIKSRLLHD
jgi:hypothetical protein